MTCTRDHDQQTTALLAAEALDRAADAAYAAAGDPALAASARAFGVLGLELLAESR